MYKIGKVKDYNNYIGKIVTEDKVYYFNKNDILRNNIIKNDDLVKFNYRGTVFLQAYYIRLYKEQ